MSEMDWQGASGSSLKRSGAGLAPARPKIKNPCLMQVDRGFPFHLLLLQQQHLPDQHPGCRTRAAILDGQSIKIDARWNQFARRIAPIPDHFMPSCGHTSLQQAANFSALYIKQTQACFSGFRQMEFDMGLRVKWIRIILQQSVRFGNPALRIGFQSGHCEIEAIPIDPAIEKTPGAGPDFETDGRFG